MRIVLAALIAASLAVPVSAKDSLGIFGSWGAFRDPQVPRCYAIAIPGDSNADAGFVSVGSWPSRNVRAQMHVRLSRRILPSSAITLNVGGKSFRLAGAGSDAWAADSRMDAAIVASMRNATSLSVSARDTTSRRFTDRYSLAGAATAMDAATVGCASSG